MTISMVRYTTNIWECVVHFLSSIYITYCDYCYFLCIGEWAFLGIYTTTISSLFRNKKKRIQKVWVSHNYMLLCKYEHTVVYLHIFPCLVYMYVCVWLCVCKSHKTEVYYHQNLGFFMILQLLNLRALVKCLKYLITI